MREKGAEQGRVGLATCFLACGENDPPEFRRQQAEFAEVNVPLILRMETASTDCISRALAA